MPSRSMSTASLLVLSMVSCVSSCLVAVAMVNMLLSGPVRAMEIDTIAAVATTTQLVERTNLRMP